MASWMVHFRITDLILEQLPELEPVAFVFGNIAPDSGVPNEDWSVFTPSKNISHFWVTGDDGETDISLESYLSSYLREEQLARYTSVEKSFYLGYLSHLLSDIEWGERIWRPCKKKYHTWYEENANEFIWTIKKDWYDLDFLYLRKYPDFRAFCIYEKKIDFQNKFMDFFAADAFENRRAYINDFYRAGREGLEREYVYLTEQAMDSFVETTAECVLKVLKKYI